MLLSMQMSWWWTVSFLAFQQQHQNRHFTWFCYDGDKYTNEKNAIVPIMAGVFQSFLRKFCTKRATQWYPKWMQHVSSAVTRYLLSDVCIQTHMPKLISFTWYVFFFYYWMRTEPITFDFDWMRSTKCGFQSRNHTYFNKTHEIVHVCQNRLHNSPIPKDVSWFAIDFNDR